MAWQALHAEVAVEMRAHAEHGWLEHDAEVYRIHGIVRAKKLAKRNEHERDRRALDTSHRDDFNAYHREYARRRSEERTGVPAQPRACGVCRELGHNARTCRAGGAA